ncbi:hypothetical protein Q0Z83_054170 [Actinoplanes sichuanensis]|uniref:Amino acid adenylation domain-containing protein n=1 Tax=Actinoplanes sichuanensis TaxID=512349 RepID=A0ABW4AT93_9ACTN|nr:amino acid adenylation domain-containing protein [Actinoplanes sichuanensis]BEL07226.1 hypothetical protein Q0Z83_054170 [Actinoplanes sichuanensis]
MNQVREEFTDTAMTAGRFPKGEALLVTEAFERARRTAPDATAVVWGERLLTYDELGAAADRLAVHLNKLDPAGGPVGILLERSFDLTVGVLAVLKSGRPYVPLDPSYPAARLEHMIADSGLRILLTSKSAAGAVVLDDDVRTLDAADWPREGAPLAIQVPIDRDDLAYVMYTSGSTGRAKGVAMPHRALANLIDWQCRHSRCGSGDRTLQFAALSFDVSFQEIFSTWASGGALVLIDTDVRFDFDALVALMEAQAVRRIFLPFVALQAFCHYAQVLDLQSPSALTEVITAGEALHVTPAVRRFFANLPDARLVNQYGPTETHVVTALELSGDPVTWPARPSVGRPIDRVRIGVLDDEQRPQPIGVPGELCVVGDAVACGYHNAPVQTLERFLPAPLSGDRMYRTGDIAVLLPDGQIELLGRQDDQVKVRGHRVELGEIESVLRSVPGIADAVVVHSPNAGGHLTAHYLPNNNTHLSEQVLRGTLADVMPAHMVPQRFVCWDRQLPRTPSGKVDRRALAEVSQTKGNHR